MKFNFKERKLMSFIALSSTLAFCASCGSSTKDQANYLVIGTDCDYVPFSWNASKESEYTYKIDGTMEFADGYDIQIAKQIAKKMNKELKVKRILFDSLLIELQQGNIDLAFGGLIATEDRLKVVDFSIPYYNSEYACLIKKSSLPNSNFGTKDNKVKYEDFLEFINGKSMVAQAGTQQDDFIDKYFSSVKHDNPLSSYSLCALDVQNGASFACLSEVPVCEQLVKKYSDLTVIYMDQSFLSDEDKGKCCSYVGVNKNNTQLKDEVNTILCTYSNDDFNKIMEEVEERVEI